MDSLPVCGMQTSSSRSEGWLPLARDYILREKMNWNHARKAGSLSKINETFSIFYLNLFYPFKEKESPCELYSSDLRAVTERSITLENTKFKGERRRGRGPGWPGGRGRPGSRPWACCHRTGSPAHQTYHNWFSSLGWGCRLNKLVKIARIQHLYFPHILYKMKVVLVWDFLISSERLDCISLSSSWW